MLMHILLCLVVYSSVVWGEYMYEILYCSVDFVMILERNEFERRCIGWNIKPEAEQVFTVLINHIVDLQPEHGPHHHITNTQEYICHVVIFWSMNMDECCRLALLIVIIQSMIATSVVFETVRYDQKSNGVR